MSTHSLARAKLGLARLARGGNQLAGFEPEARVVDYHSAAFCVSYRHIFKPKSGSELGGFEVRGPEDRVMPVGDLLLKHS